MTDTFREREKRIERMENRLQNLKAKQKTAARSRDTKRLVLMGRMMERYLEYGKVDRETFRRDMDKFLTRNYEREIFDLPPLEKPKSKKKKSPASQPDRGKSAIITTASVVSQPGEVQARKLPESGVSEAEFFS